MDLDLVDLTDLVVLTDLVDLTDLVVLTELVQVFGASWFNYLGRAGTSVKGKLSYNCWTIVVVVVVVVVVVFTRICRNLS